MSEPATASPGLLTSADHYENFPVASVLVPARLRPAVAAVYRFARFADDIADEGDAPASQRLARLQQLRGSLHGSGTHRVVDGLLPHIERHAIPVSHFTDLLSAFSQDAAGTTYADRTALLDYCARSANPVGRIVLRIFDADGHDGISAADAICTALQLINFAQDIGQDVSRDRWYVPASEMHVAGVSPAQLRRCERERAISPAVRTLLDTQCVYARELLATGPALLPMVPLRLRVELAAVMAGALTTLDRVTREDPFAARIKLGKSDLPAIVRCAVKIMLQGRLP